MQTGEGKTLVATLPVYLNALAGKGVHVVTVNDYLARRDSEWMGKLYRWLGMKVGLIVQGITNEQRHAAYNADITYGTNNEFGFDYLRDNMVVYKENMVQRGHFFAIVDEVDSILIDEDSILIDEARTPLIISGQGDASSDLAQQADAFAQTLKISKIVELDDKEDQDAQVDGDYVVDEKHKTATLTQSGVKKAEAYVHVENLADAANMTLSHHINQAIKARGVMQRDIDYVVRDGEVIIVDEFTGRLMIGRRYNEGLHQAIEAKEGVKVAAESKTLATITFQNYFRMYEKLAGMTGTAKTEADEFIEIYGLQNVTVPTNKPQLRKDEPDSVYKTVKCKYDATGTAKTEADEFIEIYGLQNVTVPTNKPQLRKDEPDSVYKTVKCKYDAVVKQVAECHAKGQPVLVGTVIIEKSETLSKLLSRHEADEFIEIYGLQIVTVPTNKPQLRKDEPDSVYKTVKGKYDAVVKQVAECHAKGQPVLVGTVSIEKSETLSKLLSRQGIKHNVLNAKNHEKEAEIVAQAGKKGAVTIATNMAGRGTDIMLGGNAEYMAKTQLRKEGFAEELIVEADGHGETDNEEILAARARFNELLAAHKAEIAKEAEEVRAAGGLYIIGTERHESRRIDNQLRGRSGRQGDPGASRFFLSLEDDLMRLFGGERVQSLMDTLGLDDETPIENKMITNTIEGAQKKLEAQNFSTRKNVLQFDDVMNKQREIIYGQRRQVLNGEDLKETLRTMMKDNIEGSVATFCAGDDSSAWDLAALRRHYLGWLTMDSDLHYEEDQLKSLKREDVSKFLLDRGTLILDGKEKKYGSNIMRELERMCLLRNVDTKWMDHIDAMDQLRQGIYLRSYGQRDPVVEYRLEGFEMFDAMIDNIKEDTVRMLLTIELKIQPQQQAPVVERTQVAKPTGDAATPGKNVKATSSSGPIKVDKIGRNDPCPCGSGLKWKKCTCKEYHPDL